MLSNNKIFQDCIDRGADKKELETLCSQYKGLFLTDKLLDVLDRCVDAKLAKVEDEHEWITGKPL